MFMCSKRHPVALSGSTSRAEYFTFSYCSWQMLLSIPLKNCLQEIPVLEGILWVGSSTFPLVLCELCEIVETLMQLFCWRESYHSSFKGKSDSSLINRNEKKLWKVAKSCGKSKIWSISCCTSRAQTALGAADRTAVLDNRASCLSLSQNSAQAMLPTPVSETQNW